MVPHLTAYVQLRGDAEMVHEFHCHRLCSFHSMSSFDVHSPDVCPDLYIEIYMTSVVLNWHCQWHILSSFYQQQVASLVKTLTGYFYKPHIYS